MEDYGAMIRNTFELGSVRDAEALFEACVENAFPTSHFRRLELIRFVKDEQYMEGRSGVALVCSRFSAVPTLVWFWGKASSMAAQAAPSINAAMQGVA